MKCPACSSFRPVNPWVTGIGYDDKFNVPLAVEYKCGCSKPRSIPWASATRGQRQQAFLAEMSRHACEMAVWGGAL